MMKRQSALVFFSVMLLGCTNPKVEYLNEAKGRANQEEIIKNWRPPTEKRLLDTGESIWLYRSKRFSSVQSRTICGEYELRFNSQMILEKWYARELNCEYMR